jgi:hypothetical protein
VTYFGKYQAFALIYRQLAVVCDGVLKKLAQPGEFSDLFGGRHGDDYVGLWRSMNFIQVTRAGRLCHELLNAFFQGPLGYEIGIRIGDVAVAQAASDGHFLSSAGALKSM